MTLPTVASDILTSVSSLDSWLESMRSPDGYGGPVSHWWQNCLQYTGPGLDWRYEGITIGYLSLWEKTKDKVWLDKAHRCGDDLVNGQLSNGCFKNSSFELNPYSAGTPHEAACDIALIRLADALRSAGYEEWEKYLKAAENNLHSFYTRSLWSDELQLFLDSTSAPGFVPNKAATLVEALFLLFRVRGDAYLIDKYISNTLKAILSHQIISDGSPLDGGIYQNSLCKAQGTYKFVEKVFPFYVARCIPALIEAYSYFGDKGYLDAALRAGRFILRHQLQDGSYPQVVYTNTRVATYPKWVAGTADILRAFESLRPFGMDGASLDKTRDWLMAGQDPGGGFRTALGFDSQVSQKTLRPGRGDLAPTGQATGAIPEFRDLLHVAGWNGKAFRYLTTKMEGNVSIPQAANAAFESPCVFRGQDLTFFEDNKELSVYRGKEKMYQWVKGQSWAYTNSYLFYLK